MNNRNMYPFVYKYRQNLSRTISIYIMVIFFAFIITIFFENILPVNDGTKTIISIAFNAIGIIALIGAVRVYYIFTNDEIKDINYDFSDTGSIKCNPAILRIIASNVSENRETIVWRCYLNLDIEFNKDSFERHLNDLIFNFCEKVNELQGEEIQVWQFECNPVLFFTLFSELKSNYDDYFSNPEPKTLVYDLADIYH
ncbi:hypothetical protein [uncultured Draconibacterium sp.]|uniref:hypothetical protein n=1 Tax=uncultured Draconibacterium sp. TaxID=1573823 RepID=UPI0029C79D54|nr:hypothetical protein [uncultured Draconibacterium sp.]